MNPLHNTANGVAFWSRGETTEEDPTALWSGTAIYGQPTLGFNSALSLSQPQDIEWGAAATVENSHRDIMAFALPGHGTNPTASPVSALPHSYPHNFDLLHHRTSLARVLGILGSCRPLVDRFRSSALRLVSTRPKAPVGVDSVSASPIDPSCASCADIFFPLAQHEQVAGTYVVSTSHPSIRVLTLIPL